MRSFLYSPEINDSVDLYNQAVRVAWYFGHLADCSFTIVSDASLEEVETPPYIDTNIAERLTELLASGRLKIQSTVREDHDKWDGLVAWRGIDAARAALPGHLVEAVETGETSIYNVDRDHRMEGSLYIDVGNALLELEPDIPKYEKRFSSLVQRYRCSNAFLFCTGPSVNEYARYDYHNGLSVICNSVIFDAELLAYVRPKVLVFADPIFHFGCSSYAQEYRRRLKQVCAEYELSLIVPIKYVNIFLASVPELENRLIGVPYRKDLEVNLDLTEHFEVRTSDNILSFLMLPVAASLARNLYLLGCDGRKLEENSYFWAHNEKTQITLEMDNIQRAHPSFFKLDYDEYYLRHCDNVAEYAAALEGSHRSLTSLTHSYIEALARRPYLYQQASAENICVSINPDLKDDFGHFYHYDLRVAENLEAGTDLFIWANNQVDVAESDLVIARTFRHNSFQIRSVLKDDVGNKFKNELIDKLDQLSLLRGNKILYMYTGDLSHAEVVVEIAESKPELFRGVRVHMNLFFMHFDVDVPTKTIARKRLYQEVLLRAQELQSVGVFLYVDSERLQVLANKEIGLGFFLWPMINVSSVDFFRSAQKLQLDLEKRNSSVTRVFCPATGQLSKGYDFACEVVRQVNSSGFADKFVFVLRNLLRDIEDVNKKFVALQDELGAYPNVEFLDGTLSEVDYASEYAKADVVLLPYRREDFYSRTSAAVVDALYFEKPIVCAADTWLEAQAQRFGLAYAYSDGDVFDCVEILVGLSKGSGVRRGRSASNLWDSTYSAGNLVDLFRRVAEHFPAGVGQLGIDRKVG